YMGLKLTWNFFGAAALFSLAVTFLVHSKDQVRIRLLSDQIQTKANLIASLRNEHERLSKMSGCRAAPQSNDHGFISVIKLRGEYLKKARRKGTSSIYRGLNSWRAKMKSLETG